MRQGIHLLPREIEAVWTLFTAPAIWAGHFLVCYFGAAFYCARRDVLEIGFGGLRIGIGVVTALALLGILLSGILAWRQWGFGTGDPPHDQDTRRDRKRFQGFATLLLAGLSAVAVVYQALPALFLMDCRP
jgi:hypothetical protein